MAHTGKWGTYVHIPKCAGFSIRSALRDHFGSGKECGDIHGYSYDITDGWTVIRHPAAWLRSFWAYRNNSGWDIDPNAPLYWTPILAMTQWLKGTTWPGFVRAVTVTKPGLVGRIYGMYEHPNISVFLLEDMEPLWSFLGGKFSLPQIHVTLNKPKITKEQRYTIEKAEPHVMSRYYPFMVGEQWL
jgi:hypothetical protein